MKSCPAVALLGNSELSGRPYSIEGPLQKKLDRVVVLFIYLRTRESKSEMAFITGSTPVWGYEKSAVKDMLQEPFSSRPVDCVAGAVGTTEDFFKIVMTNLSQPRLGPLLYIQISHVSR